MVRPRGESFSEYTTSWEPQVAETIRQKSQQQLEESENRRPRPYMVAVCGLPGSGKSISSMLLAHALEEMGVGCFVMPHDGYHIYMSQLRLMPDPADMIYRRGAPDTFDPQALLRDLWRLRGDATGANHEQEEIIKIPAFDHAKGDPEPDQHVFDRSRHRVVVCEGLYVLHDKDGWEEIPGIFDLKIFMDTDIDECMERVKIRNLCIPGYTPNEIRERVERVDRVNGLTVVQSKPRADLIVQSGVTTTTVPTDDTEKHHTRVESSVSLVALDLETHAVEVSETIMTSDPPPYSDIGEHDPSIVSLTQNSEAEPVGQVAGRWEPEMVQRIVELVKKGKEDVRAGKPIMVALTGIPGCGKSISSMLIANQLEELDIPCMVMPHDGYHYTLEYLRTYPDPQDAIYRRGAPDTFDPQALLRDLKRIRSSEEEIIKLPAFDHARGDPEPDKHVFNRSRHCVVLCEGLYLLHDQDGWEEVANEFDFRIFMNAKLDTCMERVMVRNTCIPGYTSEEIAVRVERVDRVNALTVMQSKKRADVIIETMA